MIRSRLSPRLRAVMPLTLSPAFARAGLYGGLVVKRHISRDRNRVAGRPPATPRGRVRRWSVVCRPALSFRDSAADYPANNGIPLAGGAWWGSLRADGNARA